jgi:hypothetical protein
MQPRVKKSTGGRLKPAKRAGGGALPQTSGGMQQQSPDMGQSNATSSMQTNPIQNSRPLNTTPKQFGGYVGNQQQMPTATPMQNPNQQKPTSSFNDPNAQNQPNTQLRKGGRARK